MYLLHVRNRAHPEDGIDAAPGRSGEKKCPAELRAEKAVRTYFSLDKTPEPLGMAAFWMDVLKLPPRDRVTQMVWTTEMLSISNGLLLFFAQTLATFEKGMSRLRLVSALMATAAVLLYVCASCMVMMLGVSLSTKSGSIKNVFGMCEAVGHPVMLFVYATHLTFVAFALSALDGLDGALGVGVGAFACLMLVIVYFYIGVHVTVHEALGTYHQTFWTQLDFVNGIAWFASGRRRLTERASHELDALMRDLPEDVRRVVEGKAECTSSVAA